GPVSGTGSAGSPGQPGPGRSGECGCSPGGPGRRNLVLSCVSPAAILSGAAKELEKTLPTGKHRMCGRLLQTSADSGGPEWAASPQPGLKSAGRGKVAFLDEKHDEESLQAETRRAASSKV